MFHCSVIKDRFALPFVSNSFAIISCRFLPVKNFFNFLKLFLLLSCSNFSSISCLPLSCQELFSRNFSVFTERRRRDLNPRAAINDLLPFQGSPFSLLGTSPNKLTNKRYSISIPVDTAEKVGFEPTAPCGVTGFQDRLVMTTSIPLHISVVVCAFVSLEDK